MHYLSEDPWPLVILLGAVAAGFLIALRATQDGKYLIRAGIALAVALLLLGIEQLWVTDAERIEAVVLDLAAALRASDADRVIQHFASDVEVTDEDNSLGSLDPGLIRHQLRGIHFDQVRLTDLKAQTFPASRTGKATFGALILGTNDNMTVHQGFGDRTAWDLGFEEVEPGVWKVSRISPTRLHPVARVALRAAMRLSAGPSRRR